MSRNCSYRFRIFYLSPEAGLRVSFVDSFAGKDRARENGVEPFPISLLKRGAFGLELDGPVFADQRSYNGKYWQEFSYAKIREIRNREWFIVGNVANKLRFSYLTRPKRLHP